MNKLLTGAVMLDSLIIAYIQFMIMLIQLKKSAKCFHNINASNLKQGVFVQSKTTPVISE